MKRTRNSKLNTKIKVPLNFKYEHNKKSKMQNFYDNLFKKRHVKSAKDIVHDLAIKNAATKRNFEEFYAMRTAINKSEYERNEFRDKVNRELNERKIQKNIIS